MCLYAAITLHKEPDPDKHLQPISPPPPNLRVLLALGIVGGIILWPNPDSSIRLPDGMI